MIRFLITTQYILFENPWVIYLCQLTMESQINQRIYDFFCQSWNSFSNSFIKMESSAAYFSLFTGLRLGNVSKSMCLFAKTELVLHCTLMVLSFQPGGINSTPLFGCCWHIASCARPCVGCGWFNVIPRLILL